MVHHHVVDTDKPDHFDPMVRREVLAEARQAIRSIPTDTNGSLHVSDVLAALDEVEGVGS
jgi:hypothetical protein